jgi:hypothetical protein
MLMIVLLYVEVQLEMNDLLMIGQDLMMNQRMNQVNYPILLTEDLIKDNPLAKNKHIFQLINI